MTNSRLIKILVRNAGLALVCTGAILLSAGYAAGWTDSNAFLLSAAALVVAGAILHVYILKKESRY